MIEIIAIIRPNKVADTKKVLLEIDRPGFTCIKAKGRGKEPVERMMPDGTIISTKLNNKRVFIVEARNEDEKLIVDAIMRVNSTGEPGDGKIFVVNLERSYNVRKGNCIRE